MKDMEIICRLRPLDFIRIFKSGVIKHGLISSIVTTTHIWLLSYGFIEPKLTPDGNHVKIKVVNMPW